jgi:hypothetical protein
MTSRRGSHRFQYLAHPPSLFILSVSAVLGSTALSRWTDSIHSYRITLNRFSQSDQPDPETDTIRLQVHSLETWAVQWNACIRTMWKEYELIVLADIRTVPNSNQLQPFRREFKAPETWRIMTAHFCVLIPTQAKWIFITLNYMYMKFEIFMDVKINIAVFWVMIACCFVGRYQRFGGMYHFHLQGVRHIPKIHVAVFWVMTPCCLIRRYHRNTLLPSSGYDVDLCCGLQGYGTVLCDRHQRFGRICCLHLQGVSHIPKIHIAVFWVMMPCCLLGTHHKNILSPSSGYYTILKIHIVGR